MALREDIGAGDATSHALIPSGKQAILAFIAREELVVCGGMLVAHLQEMHDATLHTQIEISDGTLAQKNQKILEISGNAQSVLALERSALNFMQRMSGVAKLTRRYAQQLEGTHCQLLDTRKTIPGWRLLDKYAVRCGGGHNHRMRLDDMILIKDNHIALAGGIGAAIEKALGSNLPVVVECDTLEQMQEAMAFPVTRLLLDNMSLPQLRQAVNLAKGRMPLEASGGVNLQTIREIAQTGVDFISVGALTHSAVAVDIGGDIEIG